MSLSINLKILSAVLLTVIFSGGCELYRDEKTPSNPNLLAELEVSFQSIRTNILEQKCASCHSGANAPHGIYLNGFKQMMESNIFPPLVVPFKPEESALYTSVMYGEMPKNAPMLSSLEIKMIYDWINAGAKENPDDSENELPENESGLPGEPCDVTKIENEPYFVPCKEGN